MRNVVLGILLSLLSPGLVLAQDGYDHHVAFDNSLADGSVYYSHGDVLAPSEFELVDGKLPVETRHFVSPPNGIRLKWRSTSTGDWSVSLQFQARYASSTFVGKNLYLWCYSEEGLSLADSPALFLLDSDGHGTPAIPLLDSVKTLPAGQWVRLRIPFDSFVGIMKDTQEQRFDSSRLSRMFIRQRLDDNKPHTLYLDEITVGDDVVGIMSLPHTPGGLAGKGYDRHIDLTWSATNDSNVQYYKIYRSFDGKTFAPLTTQRAGRTRYEDFLGESGKKAFYKISAVTTTYVESEPSQAISAATRAMSDDELLTMVQEAGFRYYWEAAHPNAGMAIEILPGDENLVALGSSGFGIMALVVGVERGFITREQGAERLVKIVRFLSHADRFHGVWPHFLDGRTGKVTPYFGKYDNGGDLVETAFLIQGLLVARQYFSRDTGAETRFAKRSRICGTPSNGIGIATGPTRIFSTGTGRPTPAFTSTIRSSAGTKR